jgi:hypothetical protein
MNNNTTKTDAPKPIKRSYKDERKKHIENLTNFINNLNLKNNAANTTRSNS